MDNKEILNMLKYEGTMTSLEKREIQKESKKIHSICNVIFFLMSTINTENK